MNPTPIRTWYRIRAARQSAEIRIYEEIGAWGVTAKQFADDLAALGELKTLAVRINSPGGDVFDALAMYQTLQRHPARVVVHIDGLCASAATLVALAGDECRMAASALFMIHEPWAETVGNADALQKRADQLDDVADQIVTLYARKTGLSAAELREWMRAETWMTAEQALDAGFVDAIDEPLRIAARAFDLSRFKNPPEVSVLMSEAEIPVVPTLEPETPPPVETPSVVPAAPATDPDTLPAVEIVQGCLNAGMPGLAVVLLQTPHTREHMQARIEQAVRVRAVCATAGVPALADALIAQGADEAAAKLATWDTLAARSQRNPVDATPPVQKQTLNRAAFAALPPQRQREYVVAGGQITD